MFKCLRSDGDDNVQPISKAFVLNFTPKMNYFLKHKIL